MKIRAEIQGLRAFSVLLVVAHHAFPKAVPGGYFGVDIFFVISGFLITSLLLQDSAKSLGRYLLDFYARRIRRILPAALLVIVISALSAFWLLGPVIGNDTARDGIYASLFLANWNFNSQAIDYFSSELPAPVLQHYWSLAIEEQFYIIWPLILFVAVKFRRKSLTFISLITLGSLFYAIFNSAAATSYFATATRIWELGIGAILACLRLRKPSVALSRIALLTLFVLAFVFDQTTQFVGLPAFLVVAMSGVVIVSATDKDWLGNSLMVRLGDMSYVIYLWHWSVLQIARLFLGREPNLLEMLGLLVLILLLSIATHVLWENPIRYSKRLVTSPSLSVALGSFLLLGTILLMKVVQV